MSGYQLHPDVRKQLERRLELLFEDQNLPLSSQLREAILRAFEATWAGGYEAGVDRAEEDKL